MNAFGGTLCDRTSSFSLFGMIARLEEDEQHATVDVRMRVRRLPIASSNKETT